MEFKHMLTLLKSEIEFAARPLPQAFMDLSQKAGENFAKFYRMLSEKLTDKEMDLAAAWDAGLKEIKNTNMTQEDFDAISGLGRTLGSIDATAQIKAIDMVTLALDEILTRLNAANAKDGKMYRRLGLLGGVLITVILL